MKAVRFIAFTLLIVLLFSSCALLPPKPTNEQILLSVQTFNENEAEPLDLIFDEMEVPQRSPGRAAAILWVADKSIQRNFTVKYDKEGKFFFVESYITLVRGEDGAYREMD